MAKLGHGYVGIVGVYSLEFHGGFVRPAVHLRFLPLLFIQHLVNKIRFAPLFPENIAGVPGLLRKAAGRMPIEDGAAKSDVCLRVAVGADRHVPAGHDEREFFASWRAKDGDALVHAPRLAAGIVLQLFEEAGVPLRVDDAAEYIVNDYLLLFGVEIAPNVRFGDLPVVGDVSAEQPALGVVVVSVKADDFSVLIA